MQCKYQLDDAFAHLDGESESSEHYRLHIDECVTCQAFLADVEAARSVWNEVAAVDLVNVDWNQLDRAVREGVAPSREDAAIRWLPAIGRGLVWAGAAAALVMVFYLGFSRTGTDPADNVIADSSDIPSPQELHELELGELVTTSGRSKTVQVAGAKLEMAQGSLCRVSKLSATETTINILGGRVTFEVAPRKKGSVFKVRAGNVKVTVVGTRFSVSKDKNGSVEVVVKHGVVDVQRSEEVASRLSAGDSIRMAATTVARVQLNEAKVADLEQSASNEEKVTDNSAGRDEISAKVNKVREKRRGVNKRKTVGTRKNKHSKQNMNAFHWSNRTIGNVSGQRSSDSSTKTTALSESAKKDPEKQSVQSQQVLAKQELKPSGKVNVEAHQTNDPAVGELKAIIRKISRANASVCILKLSAWLKRYPKHRKAVDARYAKGYCEFQRGNVRAANRIFSNLPKGNRWLRKVGDYMNPPKPR